ncbi:helix-turn-helix transcriptional regulator [Sandarakinorhabdus sp.]|uniref:helix-turn-helix transcriptional regulator n=1 Tax=Sandarakinorhabdus sp. TaxID=1916663 RepID=UPI003F6EF39D
MSELLTTKETADYLRLAPTTLEHWRLDGRGPAFVRWGRSVRYRRADIEHWLAETTEGVTGR